MSSRRYTHQDILLYIFLYQRRQDECVENVFVYVTCVSCLIIIIT
jgi:hypothetical protein